MDAVSCIQFLRGYKIGRDCIVAVKQYHLDFGKAPLNDRNKFVCIEVGKVTVGGGAPVVVQSMTNTDTADVDGTARQVAALARAGSEIVRITVDRDDAAAAVPHIKDRLAKMGVDVPIVTAAFIAEDEAVPIGFIELSIRPFADGCASRPVA